MEIVGLGLLELNEISRTCCMFENNRVHDVELIVYNVDDISSKQCQ